MEAAWWPSAGWGLMMVVQMIVGGGVLIWAHRAAPSGHGRVLLIGMVLTLFFSISISVQPSLGRHFLPTAWALAQWVVHTCLDWFTPCVRGPDGCEPADGGGSAWALLLPLPIQWSLWCLVMTMLEWSTKPGPSDFPPRDVRDEAGHPK